MLDLNDVLSTIDTPLGFRVSILREVWEEIAEVKHRILSGRLAIVEQALRDPDFVRRSKWDDRVHLFYVEIGYKRWICAVAKRENGTGYLITAYVTSGIKRGEILWSR